MGLCCSCASCVQGLGIFLLVEAWEVGWGRGNTSVTTSRSFCAEWFLVDPLRFRVLFANVACRAANLGLLCSTESSIGGSIFVVLLKQRRLNLTRLCFLCMGNVEKRLMTRFVESHLILLLLHYPPFEEYITYSLQLLTSHRSFQNSVAYIFLMRLES